MKKFIIFMLLVITSISFTSCSWFDDPANVKKVGTGYIKNDSGILLVEIEGTTYAPRLVYTNSSTRDGKTEMEPIAGMEVTVFYIEGYREPQFIAGNRSKDYLEEYFTKNYTFAVIVGIVLLILLLCAFFDEPPKRRIVHAD